MAMHQREHILNQAEIVCRKVVLSFIIFIMSPDMISAALFQLKFSHQKFFGSTHEMDT